jgi:hypothetical protein
MTSMVRSVFGGVCVGGGIALGAYSGGWTLLAAVPMAVSGIGMIAWALSRPVVDAPAGSPVPVTVDLVDRSASDLTSGTTLIAGEARPPGDAPFRFQTGTNLSHSQLAEIIPTGEGTLPSDAIGEPGADPDTTHRAVRGRTASVLVAAVAMWGTILLPPDTFWEFSATGSVTSPLPAALSDTDARPLWQWYDAALAHVGAESPELLESILDISIYDTYVQIWVYLGGDRSRVYEGRADGWETDEATTNFRSRDTFTADELRQFSAETFLDDAAEMLPEDKRVPARLEVTRSSDDIFGAARPVIAQAWFGDEDQITMEGTADGTIAPWWAPDDIEAGLANVGDALAARGVAPTTPDLIEVTLKPAEAGGFWIDYYRGATYYRISTSAGDFADPDDDMSDSEYPRFSLSDIDSAVVTRVRDDAMSRHDVDPVDRALAEITFAPWGSDGGAREDEIVIAIDYSDARGGTSFYSLAGEYLGDYAQ